MALTAQAAPVLRLRADRARLEQVLGCLLDNAVRNSRPGASVRVMAAPATGGVATEVADTGIGIDPADTPHLCTRGWRPAAARAHLPDGLGLCLAIARRLVEAHAARLTLAAAEGGGTRAQLDWHAA